MSHFNLILISPVSEIYYHYFSKPEPGYTYIHFHLHNKGYYVTGSDDAIFEPSKSRLEKKGLLPKEEGWFPGLSQALSISALEGFASFIIHSRQMGFYNFSFILTSENCALS